MRKGLGQIHISQHLASLSHYLNDISYPQTLGEKILKILPNFQISSLAVLSSLNILPCPTSTHPDHLSLLYIIFLSHLVFISMLILSALDKLIHAKLWLINNGPG